MAHIVTAHAIRQWANQGDAAGILPHLIRQLVFAIVGPNELSKMDFPAYESVNRPRFDGEVNCNSLNAWVPDGWSVWELSKNSNPASKAQEDISKRDESLEGQRSDATYVCVTVRHWQKKAEWAQQQRDSGRWKDVRAYDADDIEQWLEQCPGVAAWFARLTGERPPGVDAVQDRWDAISKLSTPALIPEVFLASREKCVANLHNWLDGQPGVLAFTSRSPNEVIDFVCAAISAMTEEQRRPHESRLVIVQNMDAWRSLRDNAFGLALIVDPALDLPPEEVRRAIENGHHVLMTAEARVTNIQDDSELPRAGAFELRKALEQCGFSPIIAEQHAESCGGSLHFLKRRLSGPSMRESAQVLRDMQPASAAACLLLGGWDGRNEADKQAIERLTQGRYSDFESQCQLVATCRDPLLLHAAGCWRLISKDETWDQLGKHVTASVLREYVALAVEVLADDDPKFELPSDERCLARIKGASPRYSRVLKDHVAETLAFLGAFGDRLEAAASVSIPSLVDQFVRETLAPTTTWHRWASLGHGLSRLAEASPTIFLRAVKEDLDRATPELLKLFHEDGPPLFGGCHHAGLLWALETLAWPKDLFPAACRLLLRLAADDPGGQWSNRPMSSLAEILSCWMPYTTASVEDRIKVVQALATEQRQAGWLLLLQLLPGASGSVSNPTSRPLGREWANSWSRGATNGECAAFIEAIGQTALLQAGFDASRWQALFTRIGSFPGSLLKLYLDRAAQFAATDLTEEQRRNACDELEGQLSRHRAFQDSDWSIQSKILDQFEPLVEMLRPRTLAFRHAWLFDHHPDRYHIELDLSFEQEERALSRDRDVAFQEVLRSERFDGICNLARNAKTPALVGGSLALATADQFRADVLRQFLVGDDALQQLAHGYIWARFHTDGWRWIDEALSLCHSDEAITKLLQVLWCERATWDRVTAQGEKVEAAY